MMMKSVRLNQMDFVPNVSRVQHYYIVKLEEPYATFVTDNN